MPCYDERTSPSYMAREYEKRSLELENALNAATRAACELAKLMPDFTDGAWDEVSDHTIKWVKDHRKMDARRRKKKT